MCVGLTFGFCSKMQNVTGSTERRGHLITLYSLIYFLLIGLPVRRKHSRATMSRPTSIWRRSFHSELLTKKNKQSIVFATVTMVSIANKLALGAGMYFCISTQFAYDFESIFGGCFLPLFDDELYSTFYTSNKFVGCYWGTEKYIVKDFQKKYPGSIKKAKVGFMAIDPNNSISNPNYRQVCSGTTGYVEVLYVELNDPETTFEPLIKFFFQFHDPTTKDQQGNDVGTQYSSVIFCDDDAQTAIAEKVKNELQQLVNDGTIKSYINKQVTTQIVRTTPFVEAHEEHQEYLDKNPSGYCNHAIRFNEWPAALN